MVFTRRKKIILIIAISVTAVVMLAGTLSEYGAVSPDAIKAHKDYINSFISEDESGWTKLETGGNGGKAVLENSRLRLEMDLSTTRFVITDNSTGAVY